MKYCPYCGGELSSPQASFCTECGEPLSAETPDAMTGTKNSRKQKEKQGEKQRERPQKRRKKKRPAGRPARQAAPADAAEEPKQTKEEDYDGYYDDVLPWDEGGGREELDKDVVKKILLLAAGVLLVAVACVALMYLL